MTKFEPVLRRSKLVLLINTSLYPISRSTSEMDAQFEAEVDAEGKVDLTAPYKGRIEVYVDKLKSDDQFIDRVVQNRLETRRYPLIKAELLSLHERDDNSYNAVGNINFHGVNKQVEGELQISRIDSKHIIIAGEITLNVSDFDVAPPTLMALKVDQMINMTLSLVVRRPD